MFTKNNDQQLIKIAYDDMQLKKTLDIPIGAFTTLGTVASENFLGLHDIFKKTLKPR